MVGEADPVTRVWEELYNHVRDSYSYFDQDIDREYFIREGSKLFNVDKLNPILPAE